jgi:predicted AlkP superfamily phosphohydrolase/phosphomutase
VRSVVIGLDGATFDLFLPWISQGKLPNLKKLIEEGTSAVQRSCLPPVTAPNWKCYSTGKNPGKLGIFWWENIDRKNRRIGLSTENMHLVKEIWDYLGEAGKKVGIINMPLTYPPRKVNGFMISGIPVPKEVNFTYPPELESRLKKDFDYAVYPKNYALIKGDSKKLTQEIIRLIDIRFRVARTLWE